METKSIKHKLNDLKSGKITAVANVKYFLEKIENENKKINAILHLNENAIKEAEEIDRKIKEGRAGKLAGLVIAVKSCINVKGMIANCASKTLENYEATFDADAVKKIKQEDAIIIGMTNMDEFASGISGETSAFGYTINPVANERVPGGSSSGSAAAVAAGFCDLALGSDTGGSIRNPASNTGIMGIKPSYGRVSRYGLIDLSMSLDQIGAFSKDVYGAALLLEIISGKSRNDPTTFNKEVPKYSHFEDAEKLKEIKIGMSSDFEKLCKNKEIYNLVENAANLIAEKLNSKIQNVNLEYVNLAVQSYYPIVYVEFFSGTRKLDGRKYGKKIEDACGEEVLRRILGGREISQAEYHGTYYRKALAAKKLIADDFNKAFKKVDVLICPVTPELPHKLGEQIDTKDAYAFDALTIPANLAGVCAGVITVGQIDGVPVGMQIICNAFNEKLMFDVMKIYEDLRLE
jgi:aspartyl-tRNA(Asn)/glutamyl-tRNA(Gln) amidotransferase subunit A